MVGTVGVRDTLYLEQTYETRNLALSFRCLPLFEKKFEKGAHLLLG